MNLVIVHNVLSGVIKGVGFEAGTLRIVFKNGNVYDYSNVSPEDHAFFMQNFGKALKLLNTKYKGQFQGKLYTSE